MGYNYLNQQIMLDGNSKLLTALSGDILSYNISGAQLNPKYNLNMEDFIQILKFPISKPIVRLTVLNRDESINYVIPNDDIVQDSVEYSEKYTNGQRKSLSFKLVNVCDRNYYGNETDKKNLIGQIFRDSQSKLLSTLSRSILSNDLQHEAINYDYSVSKHYKYIPNVNGLWYNTKVRYEQGFEYQGEIFYFTKGIFIINNFSLSHGLSSRDVSYQCTDKFGAFEGPLGTLQEGYEIPVGTPVNTVINDMLNMSCTDGYIVDPLPPIIDTKYSNFKTQSTIRVDSGGTLANIFEQLGTQMSAEYYYNNVGQLSFYPINESMNDVDKPIIWTYNEVNTDNLIFQGQDEIVNVVKVIGTNVDNKIYSYVAKNTNLNSPINIYRIRERKSSPIESPNVWSDEMAKELAEYNLRKHMILTFNYSLSVPYNPLLLNNAAVELYNEELNMEKAKFIISGISYTSGSAQMKIEITNISDLSFIGGVANVR